MNFNIKSSHGGMVNWVGLIVTGDPVFSKKNPFVIAQATPSSLIAVNAKGELVEGQGEIQVEATAIHKGVHDARPDAVCVFHLHPPYTTALGKVFCSIRK